MNLNELDRILSSEEPIVPSSSFAGNVMSRVEFEIKPRPQLPSPWIPLVLAALPLAILVAFFEPADPVLRVSNQLVYALSSWITSPANLALRNPILSVVASLLGTLMLIWLSFRLTGASR
jgi:hypothetical protein